MNSTPILRGLSSCIAEATTAAFQSFSHIYACIERIRVLSLFVIDQPVLGAMCSVCVWMGSRWLGQYACTESRRNWLENKWAAIARLKPRIMQTNSCERDCRLCKPMLFSHQQKNNNNCYFGVGAGCDARVAAVFIALKIKYFAINFLPVTETIAVGILMVGRGPRGGVWCEISCRFQRERELSVVSARRLICIIIIIIIIKQTISRRRRSCHRNEWGTNLPAA